MSMELFVLLATDTPLNTNELNEAAKSMQPVAVYEKNIDLATHTGFLPVTLGGTKTGVETYKLEYSELAGVLPPNDQIDPAKTIIIKFRWGGSLLEGAVAMYTAALYSATYNGIGFEPMTQSYLSLSDLLGGFHGFMSEVE